MWILRAPNWNGEGEITFRVLPGGMKTIGRARGADFILDAAMVSRLHCRVTAGHDGGLNIEDLDSTNGTFVNGRRVERAILAAGDTIRVGRVELTVLAAPV
jgi:pSer/pThr/pTyr-binding forkhead associated (FHA) protein